MLNRGKSASFGIHKQLFYTLYLILFCCCKYEIFFALYLTTSYLEILLQIYMNKLRNKTVEMELTNLRIKIAFN